MRKSSILLFVMSLVSLAIAALGVLCVAVAAILGNNLADTLNGDELTKVLGIFAYIGIFALLIVAVLIIGATALPGIFGIICVVKNGKFATACLIMGSIGSLRSLAWLIDSFVNETSVFAPMMVLLYFGLYTAGAVRVYADRKKAMQNGNIT